MVKHHYIKDSVIQILLAALITLALGLTYAANAQESTYDASFTAANKEGIPINVLVGQSRVINFDRSIGRFSISNPEVAEAVMVSPTQVLVNGKDFRSGELHRLGKVRPEIHRLRCLRPRKLVADRLPDPCAVPA